jgi:LysM repeat protein
MIALGCGQVPTTVSKTKTLMCVPHVDYCSGIAIPGTPTAAPTTVVSTNPPTATAPSPTQEGLIKTCNNFYKTVKGDTCAKIVEAYGTFTVSQFIEWNPAVGSDCSGLWAETYYCVGVPGTPTVRPSSSAPVTTAPSGPPPTQDGIISTCKSYHKAVSGDTCQKIVDQYGVFSLTEFQGWNPAVGQDCSGLWLGYYYCVATPSTPTAKPTTIITTTKPATPTGPSPTQEGIVSNCQRYHKAVSGDTCQKIVDTYGTFTLAAFKQWNPAVGSDCSAIWLGYYYCIGIPGTPTVKPSSTTPAPTGCTSAPTPTQPGAVCACKKWHKVASGNTCETIQKQYGISAANFNKWNPQVGSDCTTLSLGYNVCVSA